MNWKARARVLQLYQNKGILEVSIYQDGGYKKVIKVNTNKK